MEWIKIEGEGYFTGFKCSNCNAEIVVFDECFELLKRCNMCGQKVDECENLNKK